MRPRKFHSEYWMSFLHMAVDMVMMIAVAVVVETILEAVVINQ